jgi:nucleotide-binding universal stress UspA family protein
MLMGSVAEEVVRKAQCPVLTVKAAVKAPAKAMA